MKTDIIPYSTYRLWKQVTAVECPDGNPNMYSVEQFGFNWNYFVLDEMSHQWRDAKVVVFDEQKYERFIKDIPFFLLRYS